MRGDLAVEQRRDEEAGDHEEHVDPDVAAREQGRIQVVDEHDQDGDGAQSLDLGTEAAFGPGWGGKHAVDSGADSASGRAAGESATEAMN
ncbi:hypothetical protein GCM10026982_13300 [Nocardiopsis aegyptia]